MARKDHALLHVLTLLQLDKLWTNSFALRTHRPFAFRLSGLGSNSSWGTTLMDVGKVFSDELITSKCWQLGHRLSFSSNRKYETMMKTSYHDILRNLSGTIWDHGGQLRSVSKVWDRAWRFGTSRCYWDMFSAKSIVGFQTIILSWLEAGLLFSRV